MLETKTVTNGPITKEPHRVCHDTLPRLISVSLGDESGSTKAISRERPQNDLRCAAIAAVLSLT